MRIFPVGQLLLISLLLAACSPMSTEDKIAGDARAFADSNGQYLACYRQAGINPAYAELGAHTPLAPGASPSPAQEADAAMPSSLARLQIVEWRSDIERCRAGFERDLAASAPPIYPVFNEFAAASDEIYRQLARGDMSWSAGNTRLKAARAVFVARLQRALAAWGRDIAAKVDKEHEA